MVVDTAVDTAVAGTAAGDTAADTAADTAVLLPRVATTAPLSRARAPATASRSPASRKARAGRCVPLLLSRFHSRRRGHGARRRDQASKEAGVVGLGKAAAPLLLLIGADVPSRCSPHGAPFASGRCKGVVRVVPWLRLDWLSSGRRFGPALGGDNAGRRDRACGPGKMPRDPSSTGVGGAVPPGSIR